MSETERDRNMSKTNDTSEFRILDDAELNAVAGGDSRTDPGDDDDKMSGGELAALLLLGVGAVSGIRW